MRVEKAKWVFDRLFFPRLEKKHWLVETEENKYIQFDNWENAMIFEKLIELEKHLAEDREGETQ